MATRYSTVLTLINMMLGSGPLIIPQPFYQAGFILSTVWFLLVGFISFICAEYMVEVIARATQIRLQNPQLFQKQKSSILTEQSDRQDLLSKEDPKVEEVPSPLEFSEMGLIVFGKSVSLWIIVIMTVYLVGIGTSKCIYTGKVLSKVFQNVTFFRSMYAWLGLFFICGSVFSFKNIASTKLLQYFIVSVRSLSLLAMIAGAIYISSTCGAYPLNHNGWWNFDYFPELFSNTLFSFVCQSSLATIVSPLKQARSMKLTIKIVFIVSMILNLLVPVTGIMAFGDNLVSPQKGNIKYYNYAFESQLPFVYYFTSFYVFLNIASIPVIVIVIRNNIMRMLFPELQPDTLSKQTATATVIILLVILTITFTAQNYIQYVFDFTGGIFGVVIFMILPSLMVAKSRVTTFKTHTRNTFNASISNKILPYVLALLGIAFMVYNLIEVITKLID